MSLMFANTKVNTLDLSSFDVTDPDIDLSDMFRSSIITTGYVKNQANCNRFNASSNKPASLTFVVKE